MATTRPTRPAPRRPAPATFAVPAAAAAERLEGRVLLAAGNILVSASGQNNSHVVYEYTQAGALVDSIPVPNSPRGYDQIRDLVADPGGRIQLFYGTFEPYLATYDYDAAAWSYHAALDWKVFGVTRNGAVAAFRNFVYAQAQDTGPAKGIVRFDAAANYAAQLFRFPDGAGGHREPLDVTMGMDGLLYVVTYGSFPGNVVLAVDPLTMGVVRSVPLGGDTNGSYCAADAAGNLYVFGGGYLHKLNSAGAPIKSIVLAGTDIDISDDGRLLTNQGRRAVVLDLELNVKTFFDTAGAYWGEPFVAWDSYQVPATEDVTPPRVAAVYVDSTGWAPAFRKHLQSAGLGSAAYGFAVPGGAGQLDGLPWSNVDRISVRFTEGVSVDREGLRVGGAGVADYATGAFAYDDETFTATWTLADGPDGGGAPDPFAAERVRLELDATTAGRVADPAGNALDGEWDNAAGDTFPSGDGTPGGDFLFRLNFLPGDVNRNGGVVNSLDVQAVRIRQFTSPAEQGTPPNTYTAFHDVDGNCFINAIDLQQVRIRQFSSLPDGTPALAALALRPAARFGAVPIRPLSLADELDGLLR